MIIKTKLEDDYIAALIARLFSPGLFREFAKKGRSPLFSRIIRELAPLDLYTSETSVGTLYDHAFDILKKKTFRNEYVYKAAITHKVLLGTHSLKTASMINEFRVGCCKADSVIINGTSTVYEIKSERDSLSRLDNQLSSYQDVFAKINVIVGENHLKQIESMVPQSVGILLLQDRFRISTIRSAAESSEKTKPEAIFDSIRLDEAKKILALYGYNIPDVPNTQMSQALKRDFQKLSPIEAHSGMVKILRSSRSLLPISEFIEKLPKSMQAGALSSNFNKQEQSKFLCAVNTGIFDTLKWN